MTAQAYTVVDLFCGAGGLSLGFRQAGFDVIQAADTFKPAVETYTNNIGAHVYEMDVSSAATLTSADVIIGGPPCQGFSSAGLRQKNDHRNTLVGSFATIVASLRPRAFVFENVEGFLTAEGGQRVVELLDPLVEAGYQIHLRKVNAANFGVPQHRKRVIAIGGLGWSPSFPEVTHTAYGAPGSALPTQELPRTPTLADAIRGLPEPDVFPPGVVQGHYARQLSELDLARAMVLGPGQGMRDLPESLQHASYRRRAYRRVMDGTPSAQRGGAPVGIKRLKPDEPSKAVTGGMQGEFLHPYEHRPLTIRECARLQTFADGFIFFGSATEQMQLIGNAVPPLLARQIATSLLRDLAQVKPRVTTGALLSFVPTLASGVSPALKSVLDLVYCRYLGKVVAARLPLWD